MGHAGKASGWAATMLGVRQRGSGGLVEAASMPLPEVVALATAGRGMPVPSPRRSACSGAPTSCRPSGTGDQVLRVLRPTYR